MLNVRKGGTVEYQGNRGLGDIANVCFETGRYVYHLNMLWEHIFQTANTVAGLVNTIWQAVKLQYSYYSLKNTVINEKLVIYCLLSVNR